MSDEHITRKEFHDTIDSLREDVQGVREVLYNGVRSTTKENKNDLGEVKDELKDINSKLDKKEGGWNWLKQAGIILAGALASTGTFIAILKTLGAFAHWG